MATYDPTLALEPINDSPNLVNLNDVRQTLINLSEGLCNYTDNQVPQAATAAITEAAPGILATALSQAVSELGIKFWVNANFLFNTTSTTDLLIPNTDITIPAGTLDASYNILYLSNIPFGAGTNNRIVNLTMYQDNVLRLNKERQSYEASVLSRYEQTLVRVLVASDQEMTIDTRIRINNNTVYTRNTNTIAIAFKRG